MPLCVFSPISYLRDDEEAPIAAASDDGTFDEMRWLLGASEEHVRRIAAQVMLGLAGTSEGRHKLVQYNCIGPLLGGVSDPFCGALVVRALCSISLEQHLLMPMLDQEVHIHAIVALSKANVSWKEELCILLANVFRQAHPSITAELCIQGLDAVQRPNRARPMDREAMDDELEEDVCSVSEQRLLSLIAVAICNASQQPRLSPQLYTMRLIIRLGMSTPQLVHHWTQNGALWCEALFGLALNVLCSDDTPREAKPDAMRLGEQCVDHLVAHGSTLLRQRELRALGDGALQFVGQPVCDGGSDPIVRCLQRAKVALQILGAAGVETKQAAEK